MLSQEGVQPAQAIILVPYAAQKHAMVASLRKAKLEAMVERVSTVDRFQGDESEFVILSLVRSNSKNQFGFVKRENRQVGLCCHRHVHCHARIPHT